jgi:hypothetical protein
VRAEQAPDLRAALDRAKDEGFTHVILDGTVIACDRCKEPALSVRGEAIDLWYSGKAHAHGGNLQAIFAPDGFSLWASRAEPGSVHDITAARAHVLPALYLPPHRACRPWPTRDTKEPGSASTSRCASPRAARTPTSNTRTRNALQRSLRCLGERGFALLTARWRTLQHIIASPGKIGDITRAALVLTHFEHHYIK